jgi:hypothetical protein
MEEKLDRLLKLMAIYGLTGDIIEQIASKESALQLVGD